MGQRLGYARKFQSAIKESDAHPLMEAGRMSLRDAMIWHLCQVLGWQGSEQDRLRAGGLLRWSRVLGWGEMEGHRSHALGLKENHGRGFSGSPVVQNSVLPMQGHRFDPWPGDTHVLCGMAR